MLWRSPGGSLIRPSSGCIGRRWINQSFQSRRPLNRFTFLPLSRQHNRTYLMIRKFPLKLLADSTSLDNVYKTKKHFVDGGEEGHLA